MLGTVDVITPIVDDPYTFGAICAANSVSDIYAMGGTPLTALAILGFASCDFGPEIIKNLLRGSIDKLKEADTCLIGGHSIEDNEFKLGFAITGVIDKKRILKVSGASAKDILVLTKPLGTGVLTSAVKLGKMKKTALKNVIESMLELNKNASKAAVLAGAGGATDVTGFGLLGHALNMAKSSNVNLIISHGKVPIMSNAKSFIAKGVILKGARKNLEFSKKMVSFAKNILTEEKLLLSDPQTSGGLLIAISQRKLKKFHETARKEKMPYWIIGEAVKGKGKIIIE